MRVGCFTVRSIATRRCHCCCHLFVRVIFNFAGLLRRTLVAIATAPANLVMQHGPANLSLWPSAASRTRVIRGHWLLVSLVAGINQSRVVVLLLLLRERVIALLRFCLILLLLLLLIGICRIISLVAECRRLWSTRTVLVRMVLKWVGLVVACCINFGLSRL